MAEPMNVRVEVWPMAADSAGIWLLSGDDAWRPALPVMADSEPHADVSLLLAEHRVCSEAVRLVHSTSWRVDGVETVLTYVAVISAGPAVREGWPNALPVSPALPDAVGKPPTNAANEPPMPRYVDVLMHGLRHLRFLLDHDATAAEAMDDTWRTCLEGLAPALAGMYDQPHR